MTIPYDEHHGNEQQNDENDERADILKSAEFTIVSRLTAGSAANSLYLMDAPQNRIIRDAWNYCTWA